MLSRDLIQILFDCVNRIGVSIDMGKRGKFLLGVGACGVDMLTSSKDTVAVRVKAAQRKNRIFVVTTKVAKCQHSPWSARKGLTRTLCTPLFHIQRDFAARNRLGQHEWNNFHRRQKAALGKVRFIEVPNLPS